MKTYFTVYFGAVILAVIFTPLVIFAARSLNIYDAPDVRKVHAKFMQIVGLLAVGISAIVCGVISPGRSDFAARRRSKDFGRQTSKSRDQNPEIIDQRSESGRQQPVRGASSTHSRVSGAGSRKSGADLRRAVGDSRRFD